MDEVKIRRLNNNDKDYTLLTRWYQLEEVYLQFEQRKLNLDEVKSKYYKRTLDDAIVPVYMIIFNHNPVGIIQYQLVSKDNKKLYGIDNKNVYEIDIFIGKLSIHNKGIGKRSILLLADYLFNNKKAEVLVMTPLKSNKKAIKCYLNSGFVIDKYFKEDNTIGEEHDYVLMKKCNENINMNVCRCKWVNVNNRAYVLYHDKEWGVKCFDDRTLLELLILESFQAGLTWECILNKRDNFRRAYDNFDINKIINYNNDKVDELCDNKGIVRNKLKIKASINNAIIFKKIKEEYGSFAKYIWHFTNGKVIYECEKACSLLSDDVSIDLKKRGMKFVGSLIIYAYLQAIGVINSHEKNCFLYKEEFYIE